MARGHHPIAVVLAQSGHDGVALGGSKRREQATGCGVAVGREVLVLDLADGPRAQRMLQRLTQLGDIARPGVAGDGPLGAG